MKYIPFIIVSFLLLNCGESKPKPTFKLEELVSKIITKNSECNEILTRHYSVNPEDIRSYNFIDGISYRIVNELEVKSDLTRVLLIRTYDTGEVIISNSFSVLIFQDGKTLISKHIKDKPLNKTTKEVKQFNVNNLYTYLGRKGKIDVKGRRNIMIIDFEKKDSCSCSVYSDFSLNELKEFNDYF